MLNRFLLSVSIVAFLGLSHSAQGDILLSEVLFDAGGNDTGAEWVELYNSGPSAVDLSLFSLGHGGSDYTYGTYQLSGLLGAGAYGVVGGPISGVGNGDPVYLLEQEFSPSLQNAGAVADGVALFDVTAASITSTTIPIDVVIYGDGPNASNLIDETGNPGLVDVGDVGGGISIFFDGSGWNSGTPTPGTGSLSVPEPTSAAVLLGATCLAMIRRNRK